MLDININDVMAVLGNCILHIAVFVIILLLAVIVTVAAGKLAKPARGFVRIQGWLAVLLSLVIIVNLICFGPMQSLISLATGKGSVEQETSDEALGLCQEIAEEGIVLLKNEDHVLPMDESTKLNIFGWASTNPCYGGAGSGSISDLYDKVSLLEGLENAGFTLNSELSDFYREYSEVREISGQEPEFNEADWSLPEPPVSTYGNLVENAKAFSDKAVVVITRVGGEGVDLPSNMENIIYANNTEEYDEYEKGGHYLQLTHTEKDMLDMVCENFEDVILIYNSSNAMELDFVDEYAQIKGVLWCAGAGQNGFNALGKIMNGTVNPSGKTTDTFVKDLKKAPYFYNIGSFVYDNLGEEFTGVASWGKDVTPTFVNYVENIYIGYRFYETAAEEGLIKYEDLVQYPFGYGLSYTEFAQEMGPISEENGKICFEVTVTNTGSVPGKEVVEVYYEPPYTNGGLEKASVNLIRFDKTELLKPGERQTMKISFDLEEMASYDMSGGGSYVLEEGEYVLSIRSDSHQILKEEMYVIPETIIYNDGDGRESDVVAAENRFEDCAGDVMYLSRTDHFANYSDATKAPSNYSMSEETQANFTNTEIFKNKVVNSQEDKMPVTDTDHGVILAELRGMDYDDPKWEELLDELSVADMDSLIAYTGYQTSAVESVGKVLTVDCDGPAAINNNFTRVGSIGFPAASMLACTWNEELALAYGDSIGKMADEMEVSGWYAPAMNMHRSAFGGRNFEYYSEDGYLAGRLAADAVLGAQKHGIYVFIKHFALNDQETSRNYMLCTWSTEQAIRENYLKPFEMSVKEGGARAAMTGFNYIGATWCGASDALLNQVLRGEWGFSGFVVTDYFACTYFMNADQAIRNGCDGMLVAYDTDTNHVSDQESATSIQAMRKASKNILYTAVNSRAFAEENLKQGMEFWKKLAVGTDILLTLALAAIEFVVTRKYIEERKRGCKEKVI